MTRASSSDSRARAVLDAARVLVAVLPLLAACSFSPAPVHEIELVAAPATVPLIDGQPMEVWAYNGRVPGPTFRARVGEPLRVRFTNRLPQPTTIHWHGVRLPNAMDGVPGVTQPPIAPGETFVYEFTPKDAGTFWFHPHLRSSEQVERGLFGVLIVEDRDPPAFSREEVWVLDDLLLAPDGRIAPSFNTPHDLAHDGRWGNVPLVNGKRNPTFDVKPGERLRLRLVNVANGRVFAPDFGPLAPQVIAADGIYTDRPLPLAGFELAPGNRLDLDVVIPRELASQRIVVRDGFTRRSFALAEIAVADAGAAVETPALTVLPRVEQLTWPESFPDSPRAELRLDARRGGPLGIEWTIGGEAMSHSHEGTAHGAAKARYSFPMNEPSRVRFVNDSFRIHPMHLHGMFFRVLSRNGLPVDEPFSRDTVLVHRQETVDVGIVPADPGIWMAHCHILEHAEAGMMTLVEVR